jgi:hypothetical protein
VSGAASVGLAGLLVALFLLIVAALLWQESRRRGAPPGPPVYVVEDAAEFIHARLEEPTRARLGEDDVVRIIEWEVYYLQGLAQARRRTPVETVAGGSDASLDYIVSRIADVHHISYDRGHVAEVLRLESEYLASIGAVGDPVDLDQTFSDERGDDT